MDKCPLCGVGTFVMEVDAITVEAGGAPASQTWTECHCNHCGCSIEDVYRESRKVVSA